MIIKKTQLSQSFDILDKYLDKMYLIKLFLFFPIFFLISCSAAYEKVKKIDADNPKTFQQYLLYNYQQNASFEAEEMHDWNSAKLYSEKALRANDGANIYPEKISYWKIPKNRLENITKGYENLISIYEKALIKDPKNLAKAISSLDCWAEQEEEKWQSWDIERCKNNFLRSMHNIYNNLLEEDTEIEQTKVISKKINKKNQVAIVTQNEIKELMQIIYFDFDDFDLCQFSLNTLKNFINKNKKDLSKFIIFGHTDTKGSNEYNLRLSIKRAEAVKKILLSLGISEKNLSVIGKGENKLAIITPDNTKHPANRRAEVKILN